ncbi:MAG: transglycosylase SLT domain-containing protein [Bacteroidota bacterium]
MEKARQMIVFVALAVLVGCTPPEESLIKKNNLNLSSESSGSLGQGSSQGYSRNSSIDPATRNILESYGSTIKGYSKTYGFDWRLILAVMKQESKFAEAAQSHKGASGLMQIMPTTSEEVGRVLAIEDMSHPMNNIRGGIYYLRKLYDLFEGAEESDRIRLTLAAYNAGIGRVYDAQELAAYFHDNPSEWQSVKDALPLLSKRYYTLHKNVWNQEKPRAGWFGNSRQTVTYVDKVMEYYDDYRTSLN